MDINLEKKEEESMREPQREPEARNTEERPKRRRKKGLDTETTRQPGLGLDLGTMFLVCASLARDEKITFRTQRDAFFDIENNSMSKAMLGKLNANYIESDDGKNLFVIGEEALQMANFFNKDCRRPFSKGVISTREKEALTMIKVIMHGLVGDPITENERLYFSVPADPVDSDFNNIYHENLLKSFLKSFGYDAIPMNEAFAIIWSELDEEDYTGLAFSFGAGQVNCALSLMGISESNHQFSVARSGDWIDEQSAMAVGLNASKMTAIKETGVDLLNPQGREETAIKIYYENLIRYVCSALEKKLNLGDALNFPEPITVVVSGGTSKAINFEKLFEEELRTKSFPFRIKTVKKAKDQLNAVARGCLLNALNSYDD